MVCARVADGTSYLREPADLSFEGRAEVIREVDVYPW